MIKTMIGEPMYSGFAGKPIPAIVADVVHKEGKPVLPIKGISFVLMNPAHPCSAQYSKTRE